mgnify:CR=1 FL=1
MKNNKNPNSICFRPKGYLMMCRFFSGEMQKHPALQKYDGYIRFDDDSFLIEPFISQNNFYYKLYSIDISIFYRICAWLPTL